MTPDWRRAKWSLAVDYPTLAALDRLFENGYITDPTRNAKSVVLTDLGLAEAHRLFKGLFAR